MRRAPLRPNPRALSWSLALRSEPLPQQPAVRECRLKVSNGLRATPCVALSTWRGVSGKRYVVTIHDVDAAGGLEPSPAVVLGVRRRENGVAVLLGAGHLGSLMECAEQAALDGATEIHVHRLAETRAERDAMVRDLVDDDV